MRLFYAVVGLVYWAAGWSAVELLLRISRMQPGDQTERNLTAKLFSISPSARWLAVIIGLGLIAFCANEIRRLYTQGREILRPQGHVELIDEAGTRLGQIGITGRAIVLAIIGSFLILSGLTFDPRKVRGISGALREIQEQRDGPWLLVAIAVGLIAYGLYMLIMSWRRRIDPAG